MDEGTANIGVIRMTDCGRLSLVSGSVRPDRIQASPSVRKMKAELSAAAIQNEILSKLDCITRSRLLERARLISLEAESVLAEPGDEVQYAYFCVDAVVALVSNFEDGRSMDVGMVGREGISDAMAVLATGASFYRNVVRLSGRAIRIPMAVVAREFKSNPEFQELSLRFVQHFFHEIAQSAACNHSHTLHQRLGRWLLTLGDRIGSREASLTHETIGRILGSTRADISRALGVLKESSAIAVGRGKIRIVDRQKLLRFSCECYPSVCNGSNS